MNNANWLFRWRKSLLHLECKGDLPIIKYQHITDLIDVIIINLRIDYIIIQYTCYDPIIPGILIGVLYPLVIINP
jgi:hypothetical protein